MLPLAPVAVIWQMLLASARACPKLLVKNEEVDIVVWLSIGNEKKRGAGDACYRCRAGIHTYSKQQLPTTIEGCYDCFAGFPISSIRKMNLV